MEPLRWLWEAAKPDSWGTEWKQSASKLIFFSNISNEVAVCFVRGLKSCVFWSSWHLLSSSFLAISDRLLSRVRSIERNFYRLDIIHVIDRLVDLIISAWLDVKDIATDFSETGKCLGSLNALYGNSVPAPDLEFAFKNLIPALVHRVVYQYLIGYVDRGGAETYNSGSLEFGATYVSLLLFKAAYFWIWFREVAPRKVSCRVRDGKIGKWEPKFKPPREKDARGGSQKFQCLRLGGYHTRWAAEVVCQIARFYYNMDERLVKLVADGFEFEIPELTRQEQGLAGMEKWNMVSDKAKEVYDIFEKKHERYMELLSNVEQVVGLSTEQGGGSGPHDHTRLPQPPTNLPAILDAASSEIDATSTGSSVDQMSGILPSHDIQEGSSALLPDSAVSGADAIAGEANIFRAVVYDINKFGEGQGTSPNHAAIATAYPSGALTNLEASETPNLEVSTSQPSEGKDSAEKWRQTFQEIMSEDIQLPT